MEAIYYLSSIIFICIELSWILSPIEKTNDAKKFFELTKQFKGKKWSELSKEYKSEIKSKVWLIFVLFWMFKNDNTTLSAIIFGWQSDKQKYPNEFLTENEEDICITLIQWLGSPIGQDFLDSCGFIPKNI
jgi:hypothetical protein